VERADWIGAPEGLARIEGTGVTTPTGFRAAGVAAGLKGEGLLDLGLLVSDRPCASALVDTASALPSAAVTYTRTLHAGSLRGVVVNSGCANAATGEQGVVGARAMGETAAAAAGVPVGSLAVCSTGVIGERLPMKALTAGMDQAAAALSPDGGLDFGPDMATMLAFIATDARVARPVLETLVREVADRSFNRVTVDGDTSTNDSFVLIATGCADAPAIETAAGAAYEALRAAVLQVAQPLAQAIARDGEGATKYITVEVGGAASDDEALRVARSIANSPLVKTAFFASDPNLGRLLMAIGNARVEALDTSRVHLWLGDVLVIERGGRSAAYREEDGARVMAPAEITVRVDLGRGAAATTVWTCDYSYDYVKINAEYRT